MTGNHIKTKELILCKPSGLISTSADLTSKQRKAYNVLLYNAKSVLVKTPDKDVFMISIKELKNLIGDKSTDNKNLKESILELGKTPVEYNILSKDLESAGVINLVSEIHIKINEKGAGVVLYSLSSSILKKIRDNFLYAKIDLLVVKDLKSKYSIILYELIKDYLNVEIPKIPVEKCKELFGLNKKYENNMFMLKKKVLDPACEEINGSPDINYQINYKIYNNGIKFKFKTKNPLQEQPEPVIKPVPKKASMPAKNLSDDFSPLSDVLRQYFDKKNKGI